MKSRAIIAVVGMAGSGKSIASRVFEKEGLTKIRFGDITDEVLARKGLGRTEKNERRVREEIRKKQGMAAYALLNIPRIEQALKKGSVVIDGLYSWEEFRLLKRRFGRRIHIIAVHASSETRYKRLANRKERPLTHEEAVRRDFREIERIGKAGPIAMADWNIFNEGKGIKALEGEVEGIWKKITRS